jgi:hypothetical protein
MIFNVFVFRYHLFMACLCMHESFCHQHFLLSDRNREIRRIKDSMRAGNSLAFLCQDINELEHSYQANLPRVSVVMPLKGFGEHNLHNWRSQVGAFSFFCFFPMKAANPFPFLLLSSSN